MCVVGGRCVDCCAWWAVDGMCCVVGDMCRAVGGGRWVADGLVVGLRLVGALWLCVLGGVWAAG